MDLAIDPQFIVDETVTADLIAGRFDRRPSEPIEDLQVIDAIDGIFYPSLYTLSDETMLLSYRLGHSAWLREGDSISGSALPILRRSGVTYRAVLEYETLTPHR